MDTIWAGWYQTAEGSHERWHDGAEWTDHIREATVARVAVSDVVPESVPYEPSWEARINATVVDRTVYAGWWRRVGAYLIDGIPPLVVLLMVPVVYGPVIEVRSVPEEGVPVSLGVHWLTFGVTLGLLVWFYLFNTIALQGRTGSSIGKKVMGITVLGFYSHRPAGYVLTFVRTFAHSLDRITVLGFLWPAWDHQKRTFADMMCTTRVYKTRPRAGWLAVTAALLSMGACGVLELGIFAVQAQDMGRVLAQATSLLGL